ncbi:MAG: hypothetical protein IPN19_09900 [Elusimicrobia bacterium]|nr:hypothetical protein [Elusimicrobiota bacterium]
MNQLSGKNRLGVTRLLLAGAVALSVVPSGALRASSYEYGRDTKSEGSTSVDKLSKDIAAANDAVARLNANSGKLGVQKIESPGEKAAKELQQTIQSFREPKKDGGLAKQSFETNLISMGGLLGDVVKLQVKMSEPLGFGAAVLTGRIKTNDGRDIGFSGTTHILSRSHIGINVTYSDGRKLEGQIHRSWEKASLELTSPKGDPLVSTKMTLDKSGRLTSMESAITYKPNDQEPIMAQYTIDTQYSYKKDGSVVITSVINKHDSQTWSHTIIDPKGHSVTTEKNVSRDGKVETNSKTVIDAKGVATTNSVTTVKHGKYTDTYTTTSVTKGKVTTYRTKGIVFLPLRDKNGMIVGDTNKDGLMGPKETWKFHEVKFVEEGTITQISSTKYETKSKTTYFGLNGDELTKSETRSIFTRDLH